MKALQPKLPLITQPLKDHANVVSALRELEEKGNGEIGELEEKKKNIGEEELKIKTDTEAQIKAIREKMMEQIKKVSKQPPRRGKQQNGTNKYHFKKISSI